MTDVGLPLGLARLVASLPDAATTVVVRRGDGGHAPPMTVPPTADRSTRRTRFLDGRLAATTALARLGLPDARVGVGPRRSPQWPAGTIGSISHTRDWSIAAVARTERLPALGIDIEDDQPADDIEAVVLSNAEREWLDGLETKERRHRLLSAFSAKEAVYKACFPAIGRFFGFDAVALSPEDGGWSATFMTTLSPGFPAGRRIHVASSWSGDLVCSWTTLDPQPPPPGSTRPASSAQTTTCVRTRRAGHWR